MKLIRSSLLVLTLTFTIAALLIDANPLKNDLPLNIRQDIENYLRNLNETSSDLPSVVKYVGATIARVLQLAGNKFDPLVLDVQNAENDEEQQEARHKLAAAVHEFAQNNELIGDDELSKTIDSFPDYIKKEGHEAFNHIIDLAG